ncbi:MAG: MFS transporter [Planctomycetales bacterium]|nr:MFS transporter [Planctomycetales bacterium]
MFSLILAGEIVFLPAFHLGRYFKSSMLTTFGIDEFQLGQLGAIYGMLATGCYFLGGPIADRWAPRKLLGISLAATGIASFYMATIPSFRIMCAIYAFWGVSTILAFWAPLIRATREYAGDDGQGRAFGVLDGGRGLASAVIASVAAHVFAAMVGGDAASNPQAELMAVRGMVVAYGCLCFAAAACVWFFVPDTQVKLIATDTETPVIASPLLRRLLLVLKSPAIWLQAVVIIAAYSAFKMLDNYGIYAEDAYGLSRSDSAKLLANVSYVRVGAALAAGWIADRLLGVRFTIQCCFLLLLLAYSLFLVVSPSQELVWLLTCNMIVSCVGFFALRGIYFALLEESGIPANLTGTAVGIISFVGFTPEIFMGPFTGWVIREARAEGNVLVGYQFIFAVLIGLSLAGAVSAFALRWFCRAQVSSARDAVSE